MTYSTNATPATAKFSTTANAILQVSTFLHNLIIEGYAANIC